MKNLFLVLIIFVSNICYAYEWTYTKESDSFYNKTVNRAVVISKPLHFVSILKEIDKNNISSYSVEIGNEIKLDCVKSCKVYVKADNSDPEEFDAQFGYSNFLLNTINIEKKQVDKFMKLFNSGKIVIVRVPIRNNIDQFEDMLFSIQNKFDENNWNNVVARKK